MKNRHHFNAECPRCGEFPVTVLTDENMVGYAFDGDDVWCPDCNLLGTITVGEQCPAYVDWEEFDNDLHDREDVFEFMALLDNPDLSDGAWQAVLENAVTAFNEANGTDYDPFNTWLSYVRRNSQQTNDNGDST